MDEVIASTTKTKRLPNRYEFSATAQLVHREGNERPYFSVTGELRNLRRRGDNQVEECGMMHDDILKHFPSLAPVVAVHLSDDDGTPMHAVENGLYFLGLTQFADARNLSTFASVWRVSESEAREIDAYVSADPNPREALTYLAKLAAPKWKKDAETALRSIQGQY